jgi:hypothetical protein
MLKQLFVIAVLASLSNFAMAEKNNPFFVMDYGNNYYKGSFPRKGDWHGLYCNGLACEIRKAQVRISSSTAKDVLGENEPIDVLKIKDKPVALFHNMSFNLGMVTTWFNAEKRMDEYPHYLNLKNGSWEMPWGNTPLSISWEKLTQEYTEFHYFLSNGTKKQFLFRRDYEGHYGGSTTPFIHWVGDLDGDGKIDFLVSLPDDNCGYDERMYLSSLAKKDEFIHMAAQFSGGRAACGC